MEGEWRLQAAAFGETGALPRVAIAAAVLLPHYAQIRAMSRVAVADAMQVEMAGHLDQGVDIREDVMRLGGLMRAEARTLIGGLVGSSVAIGALQRPAGAKLIVAAPDKYGVNVRERLLGSGVEMRRCLLAQYDAFLQKAGRMEQSARAHHEVDAAVKIRLIASTNIINGENDVFGPRLQRCALAGGRTCSC